MKFRLLCLLVGMICFSSCSQDDDLIFKGGYTLIGNSSVFVSCDGVVMNIKQKGKAYGKMRNRYIAFEMDGHPVFVTFKGKIIKSIKLKNGKEIKDIEITSLLDMEIGKNCTGQNVNY